MDPRRVALDAPLGERDANPLGEIPTSGQVGVGQEDRELLAAEPDGKVDVAHGLTKDVRERAQRPVAASWPYLSFTFLKSSRSASTIASGEPLRRDRASSASICARKRRRLAETRQFVGDRLTLHETVQVSVLERDQCLSCDPRCRILRFVGEPGRGG